MLVVVGLCVWQSFFEVCDYWVLRAHLNSLSLYTYTDKLKYELYILLPSLPAELYTCDYWGYIQNMEHFLCSPAAHVIKAQHWRKQLLFKMQQATLCKCRCNHRWTVGSKVKLLKLTICLSTHSSDENSDIKNELILDFIERFLQDELFNNFFNQYVNYLLCRRQDIPLSSRGWTGMSNVSYFANFLFDTGDLLRFTLNFRSVITLNSKILLPF